MKLLMQGAAFAAALTLAACGGGETQSNDMAADNAMMMNDAAAMNGMDANMMMDANGTMDANGMMGANGTMDANATMDSNTHNAMMKDATTNNPDTNLANGM